MSSKLKNTFENANENQMHTQPAGEFPNTGVHGLENVDPRLGSAIWKCAFGSVCSLHNARLFSALALSQIVCDLQKAHRGYILCLNGEEQIVLKETQK